MNTAQSPAPIPIPIPAPAPFDTPKNRWQRFTQMSAYHWVLFSQVFVVLPHANHLPVWLLIYAFFVITLQILPVKSRLPKFIQTKKSLQIVQFLGFFTGLAGLYLTFRTALGLEVGVAFLLLCAISKLFELYTRRDAYVVLSLSLFVLAGLFLMDQSLLTTLEVILGVLVVMVAMIAQNDDGTGRYRTLGLLVLQAIPLMVILFIFFPRFPPFWALKMSSNQATTGMSDSMSPGDFAKLSKSTELAFRVEFTGKIPPRQNLYWRGLVFSDFDGVKWQPHDKNPMVWMPYQSQRQRTPQLPPSWVSSAIQPSIKPATQTKSQIASQNLTQNVTQMTALPAPQSYHVILEKTGQPWLFGLDYPLPNQNPTQLAERGVGLTRDFTLRYYDNIAQRFDYDVTWYARMHIDSQLSDSERQLYLTLPASGNPKSHDYAKALFAKVGNDPIAYTQAIQQWITTQNFGYTLSPPELQNDRIDGFLFGTRAGFCEHYASSFTFLMRAVGIPARVVVGYQGGQLGRDGKSWEVRQMDAHAWSEIWLAGRGWVRVDPTSFIAPERVNDGMDNLTQTAGAKMFGDGVAGQVSYQQFQLLQQARRVFDQAGYYWQKEVVGYDQDSQKTSLLKWFNISSLYQQVLAMALSFSMVLALIVLWLWWQHQKVWDKADLAMVKLSKRLGKKDKTLARQDSEGVLAWLERIEPKVADKDDLTQLKSAYRQQRYAENSHQSGKNLMTLAKKVRLQR